MNRNHTLSKVSTRNTTWKDLSHNALGMTLLLGLGVATARCGTWARNPLGGGTNPGGAPVQPTPGEKDNNAASQAQLVGSNVSEVMQAMDDIAASRSDYSLSEIENFASFLAAVPLHSANNSFTQNCVADATKATVSEVQDINSNRKTNGSQKSTQLILTGKITSTHEWSKSNNESVKCNADNKKPLLKWKDNAFVNVLKQKSVIERALKREKQILDSSGKQVGTAQVASISTKSDRNSTFVLRETNANSIVIEMITKFSTTRKEDIFNAKLEKSTVEHIVSSDKLNIVITRDLPSFVWNKKLVEGAVISVNGDLRVESLFEKVLYERGADLNNDKCLTPTQGKITGKIFKGSTLDVSYTIDFSDSSPKIVFSNGMTQDFDPGECVEN